MLKQTRHEQILHLVKGKGSIETSELCKLFSITEMTARRDLDELARQGLLNRTHGGAILSIEDINYERPLSTRQGLNIAAKEAIARSALRYVIDGQKLFSTAVQLS